MSPVDPFISVADVARMTGLSQSTLYTWRHLNQGPQSSKFGDRVVYRLSEVVAWIDARVAASGRGDTAREAS